MNNKLVAMFVIAVLLIGVAATSTSFTYVHAKGGHVFTGPGGSDQVSSHSLKKCEKESPGNSPCR